MTLTIELLVSLGGALVTLLGFWWGLARWIIAEFGKRDLAIQAEHARSKLAEDELRRALDAHRLYAAENFAAKHEVADAVRSVQGSIERLTNRLDKLLLGSARDKDA